MKKITVEVEGDDAEVLIDYLSNIERLLTEIRDSLAVKKPAPRRKSNVSHGTKSDGYIL